MHPPARRRRTPATLLALAAAAVLALLTLTACASASPAAGPEQAHAAARAPVEKAIWGPVTLTDGSSAFPIYRELRVDVLQMQLDWAQTAPTRPADPANPDDPAYRWPRTVDTAVAGGAENGIQIALMVRGTPGWANGGREPRWAPGDPADYAAFVTAAAKRYSGVRRWMIWGEPTREGNFEPMPANSPVGPRRYALLLDAAYGALKAVSPRNIVIGGMTWTLGLVPPPSFVKWMRLPNGKPPRLDWYGHNPFTVPSRFPKLREKPYYKGLRDLNDIDTLHREVKRAYRGRRAPKLWLSEFTMPSDRRTRAYEYFVSRKRQAQWITAAFRMVNRTDYVAGLGWFDLQDEDPADPAGLTTGLITHTGEHKPAFSAYRNAR
jgi:hypothetical protein